MSFNQVRSAKNKREINEFANITTSYCDKRSGNRNRHKIYVNIEQGRVCEVIQRIQSIIKKNYPESYPSVYRGPGKVEPPTCVQIVWLSNRVEMFNDEIFKIVTEDKGYSIEM